MQDLAARETAGDIVGLSLRAHRGTVSCQVSCGCNQHVCTSNRTAQGGVLRKCRFDGLYSMEVAVLAQEQALCLAMPQPQAEQGLQKTVLDGRGVCLRSNDVFDGIAKRSL